MFTFPVYTAEDHDWWPCLWICSHLFTKLELPSMFIICNVFIFTMVSIHVFCISSQWHRYRCCNEGRQWKFLGSFPNLLHPLKYRFINEVRQWKSWGSSSNLSHPLKCRLSNDDKQWNSSHNVSSEMHFDKFSFIKHFNWPKLLGSSCKLLHSHRFNSLKFPNSANICGSSFKLEQHDISIENTDDFNPPMLWGILVRLEHSLKEKLTSDVKLPIPWGSCDSFWQEDKSNDFNDESFSKLLGSSFKEAQACKLSSCGEYNDPIPSGKCSNFEQ